MGKTKSKPKPKPKPVKVVPGQWTTKIVGHDRVAPDQLVANPLNYRKHPQAQRDALRDAIAEVGFIRSVTVNKRTGNLIDGHERVWQALTSEQPFIDVEYVDLSEDEEKKALATMDPISEMAQVDGAVLDQLLRDVNTGSEALSAMLSELAEGAGILTGPTEVTEDLKEELPDLPADPISKRGDLWILGGHRLLCGDCRDEKDVSELLDPFSIDLVFTSPPYAQQREYDKASGFKTIPPSEYVDWYSGVALPIWSRLSDDGSYFLNIKESCNDGQRQLYVKELTVAHVRQWSWRFVDEFVWKHEGIPGKWNNRLKNQWEPVFHFAKTDQVRVRHSAIQHESDRAGKSIGTDGTTSQGNVGFNGHVSHGLALPGNVVCVNHGCGRDDSAKHPAKFPVPLPSFFIRAFSDIGDLVYEPFSGSGTTIIAAEQLNRRCYAMEISPAYCDVAVKRWENLTGKKAERAK